ncbi:MAG: guanine deaminase [Gammaproteobacteria bacterium]|nr:guanine deaminase [Gammaproteobacteria bacterium]
MTISAHRGEILHFLGDPGARDHAGAWQHFPDGALLIEDGRVSDCGDAREVLARIKTKRGATPEITEHPNCLIVPGLVDAHVHYPQCEVVAAYGAQLLEWLEKHTFPAEARFHDRAHAGRIADFFLDELLRNGTTTALVFGSVHPQSVDAFFEAAEARNLRMICGKVMMDRNAPPEICDTPQTGYDDSRALIKKWHGRGRLGYAVTPRFAPTSSDAQLRLAGKLLAENPGVHLHTHIAENRRECEWVAKLFPQCDDYLGVYERHGLLGRRAMFAHAIHLSESEWSRLSRAGAGVAFCPTSNLFIGSGLFPLHRADSAGARVALGTDIGGGDSFSLLRTVNEAYKVQQLQERNLSPMRALYLATLGGARALDLQDHIGNFERGKEADFITLNFRATRLIEMRARGCKTLAEKLFVLLMLGDDRAIGGTWILGEKTKTAAENLPR